MLLEAVEEPIEMRAAVFPDCWAPRCFQTSGLDVIHLGMLQQLVVLTPTQLSQESQYNKTRYGMLLT